MNKKALQDDRMDIGKDFAHAASDLTDEEISKVFKVVEDVRMHYAGKKNSAENLEALRDEVLTRLMEIGILATLDPAPAFYGEPPTLEIVGKIAGSAIYKDGFDHDLKKFEVQTANSRGEDWLGQKEDPNPKSKAAKRERNRKEKVRKLQEGEGSV